VPRYQLEVLIPTQQLHYQDPAKIRQRPHPLCGLQPHRFLFDRI